ncbi:hypothetical protein M433DRAFT_143073 [Acidomyces richmondensis BFW]|nr:MAG: hypothetical protein FE78DRAFT_78881 [Acidomyces sp. 'richmondensis']KYG46328.1 hypothetical protein M433DRAFT_143073 [Acidomyces richmondensis BFW]
MGPTHPHVQGVQGVHPSLPLIFSRARHPASPPPPTPTPPPFLILFPRLNIPVIRL